MEKRKAMTKAQTAAIQPSTESMLRGLEESKKSYQSSKSGAASSIHEIQNQKFTRVTDKQSTNTKDLYGDRCPLGYKKISNLGKGGTAYVWLAESQIIGKDVAMKQFPKVDGEFDKSIENELEFQNKLFPNSVGNDNFAIDPVMLERYPGLNMVTRLID